MADHDFPPESPEMPTGSLSRCEACGDNMMRFRGEVGCVNSDCEHFSMPEVLEFFENEPEEMRAFHEFERALRELEQGKGRLLH